MSEYLVIIESGRRNYSAFVPDLPGCVATGHTRDEVLREIREAMEFHIEGMREDGLEIPPPTTNAASWDDPEDDLAQVAVSV